MPRKNEEKAVPMITRSFNTHTIKAVKVLNVEGQLHQEPLEDLQVECESMDNAKALFAVADKFGKDGNYFILSISTITKKIGMTVEEFLKHGIEIKDKKKEEK